MNLKAGMLNNFRLRVGASRFFNNFMFILISFLLCVFIISTFRTEVKVLNTYIEEKEINEAFLPTECDESGDVIKIYLRDKNNYEAYKDLFLSMACEYGHVGGIHFMWKNSWAEIKENLVTNDLSIALVRPEEMETLRAFVQDNYLGVAHYDDYNSYLIATQPLREKNLGSIFSLNKIGLLNDINSRSGYIEPIEFLNKHGVSADQIKIVQYRDNRNLLCALKESEVNIIGTYLDASLFDNQNYYDIKVGSEIPGLKWYVNKKNISEDFLCSFKKVLTTVAKNISPNNYFHKINWTATVCK